MASFPDLVGSIERWYRAQEKKDRWGKDRIHVSDLAVSLPEPSDASCGRALWLRLRGARERPASMGEMLMWDHGSRIHERIVQILMQGFEGSGWRLQAVEESVFLPPRIYGRLDLEVIGPEDERIIVDFKTVRGAAFRYLERPRAANVLQVQAYVTAHNANGGMLLYLDREGQNPPKQFPVPRHDETVQAAIAHTMKVATADRPPPVHPCTLVRNKNKGPDSLKLELPWQCQYCSLLDVSCPGAIPENLRNAGVIAHVHEGGKVVPKAEAPKELVAALPGEVPEVV